MGINVLHINRCLVRKCFFTVTKKPNVWKFVVKLKIWSFLWWSLEHLTIEPFCMWTESANETNYLDFTSRISSTLTQPSYTYKHALIAHTILNKFYRWKFVGRAVLLCLSQKYFHTFIQYNNDRKAIRNSDFLEILFGISEFDWIQIITNIDTKATRFRKIAKWKCKRTTKFTIKCSCLPFSTFRPQSLHWVGKCCGLYYATKKRIWLECEDVQENVYFYRWKSSLNKICQSSDALWKHFF